MPLSEARKECEFYMYKEKIDKLIKQINKIARLKRISSKLENIYEEYELMKAQTL